MFFFAFLLICDCKKTEGFIPSVSFYDIEFPFCRSAEPVVYSPFSSSHLVSISLIT